VQTLFGELGEDGWVVWRVLVCDSFTLLKDLKEAVADGGGLLYLMGQLGAQFGRFFARLDVFAGYNGSGQGDHVLIDHVISRLPGTDRAYCAVSLEPWWHFLRRERR
jgi:hypothetical protein